MFSLYTFQKRIYKACICHFYYTTELFGNNSAMESLIWPFLES